MGGDGAADGVGPGPVGGRALLPDRDSIRSPELRQYLHKIVYTLNTRTVDSGKSNYKLNKQHVEAATKMIKANKAHVVGAWVLLEELATVMPEALDTKLAWSRRETTRTALLAAAAAGGGAAARTLQPADRPGPEVHRQRAGHGPPTPPAKPQLLSLTPLPVGSHLLRLKTLPLPCVSTAFATKDTPFALCGSQVHSYGMPPEVIKASLDCAAQLTKSAEKTKSAGQAMTDKWAGVVLGECDEELYNYMFGPGAYCDPCTGKDVVAALFTVGEVATLSPTAMAKRLLSVLQVSHSML